MPRGYSTCYLCAYILVVIRMFSAGSQSAVFCTLLIVIRASLIGLLLWNIYCIPSGKQTGVTAGVLYVICKVIPLILDSKL